MPEGRGPLAPRMVDLQTKNLRIEPDWLPASHHGDRQFAQLTQMSSQQALCYGGVADAHRWRRMEPLLHAFRRVAETRHIVWPIPAYLAYQSRMGFANWAEDCPRCVREVGGIVPQAQKRPQIAHDLLGLLLCGLFQGATTTGLQCLAFRRAIFDWHTKPPGCPDVAGDSRHYRTLLFSMMSVNTICQSLAPRFLSGAVHVPVGEGGADAAEGIVGQAAARVGSVEELAVVHHIEQLRGLSPLGGEAAAGPAVGRGERRRKARR